MNKQLTKTELLLIRACKTNNAMQRLVSVYKRQYGVDGSDTSALLSIISGIVDEHHPITASKLVRGLSPSRRHLWPAESYNERVLLILVSHLRLTKTAAFNGWVSPAPFRNKKLAA